MLRRSRLLIIILVVVLLGAVANAQTTLGTILGTVTDSSGAIVRGAKVSVTQVTTGLVRTETTNATGEYSFPQLPVGLYRVEAEMAGFKKTQKTGIDLRVEDTLRVDLALQIGQLTETVAVEATAPVVSTDTSTLGGVVDNKTVTELPLNGRDFNQLSLMVAGVNPGTTKGTATSASGSSAMSVNGNRAQSNNFLIDGSDNNDLVVNYFTVDISTEAIQEFKVQTSTYSAEFGRSPGGQVNVATKSGTNEFHGVAYEYLRNADLDAKNFFASPGPIPAYKRNQFGASLGGPIKKNRTFFFANYEGTRIRQASPLIATVPTAQMKTGNFSSLPVLIYDPSSLQKVNGVLTRTPFPGNMIPATDISKVGANVINLFPNPNAGSVANSGTFTSDPTTINDFNQYTGRIDHRFGDNDSLFVRATHSHNPLNSNCGSLIPGGGLGFLCPTANDFTQGTLGYTHLMGANKIFDVRIAFNRLGSNQQTFPPGKDIDYTSQLGISGSSPSPVGFGLPSFSFVGYSGSGESTNQPQRRFDNTYEPTESFSWIKGQHSMKFGADIRRYQLNGLIDASTRGSIAFNPYYTASITTSASGVVSPVTNTGNAIADALLGDPYTSLIGVVFGGQQAIWTEELRTFAVDFFAQDDYRVRPDLTLNLGLRYEYDSPAIDKYNHLSNFDPALPGGLLLATPQKQNIYGVKKDQFAPRIGFAYTPFGPKTVFRGGFGYFWDVEVLNMTAAINGSAPFVTQETFQQSTTGVPNIALASPWSGVGTAPTPGAYLVENPYHNPYIMQWNFNIQQQLSSSLGLTVGYVGSKGTDLMMTYDDNAPPVTAAYTQSLRPYPQFGTVTTYSPGANSNYNSLQISFEKRFAKGLSFMSSYTFSKSIDDSSSFSSTAVDVHDFALERGLSSFDTRQRWVSNYIWYIPYGHGQPYGANASTFADLVLGGWQMNGIFTLQTGIPIDPSVGLQLSGTQTGTRPDVSCNPNNFAHTVNEWFNTACFSDNFVGRYGTSGRDVIIGPGVANLDYAMLKKFGLGKEQRYLQFRAEIFNIFNHPDFDNPNATFTSATFGKITSATANARQIQLALRLAF